LTESFILWRYHLGATHVDLEYKSSAASHVCRCSFLTTSSTLSPSRQHPRPATSPRASRSHLDPALASVPRILEPLKVLRLGPNLPSDLLRAPRVLPSPLVGSRVWAPELTALGQLNSAAPIRYSSASIVQCRLRELSLRTLESIVSPGPPRGFEAFFPAMAGPLCEIILGSALGHCESTPNGLQTAKMVWSGGPF
jgi:hypothetical protein